MESFHWGKHFETGLPDIDGQHRGLVDLIDRLGDLLARPDGMSGAEIGTVFGDLATYAEHHFRDEEGLMAAAGVDQRHATQQHREHRSFLQEVTLMRGGVSAENPESGRPLLSFLTHWLAYHILGSDQRMARQMEAIRSGQSAGDAYLASERIVDGAAEPLLHALNGLFQQVSARNRELLELNRTLEARVEERTRALSEANMLLEQLASTDALTGLPNRRHAMARLGQMWAESVRDGTPLACMMIDADGFKQVNDTCGHGAGDDVLRQLSRELLHSIRTDDAVSRLGGDEFLIACPRTTLEGALHLAELTRKAVSAMRVRAGDGVWLGSISVGVAVREPGMQVPEDLIRAADAGVYVAKHAGRNRVASWAASGS